MRYSRFEILAMTVGIIAVLGTSLTMVRDTNLTSEVIGQVLILVALFSGLHYGRKGALVGFLASISIYAIVVFATLSETSDLAYLLIFRAVVYAIVAFVAGELHVRLKYLFIKLEHHDYVDDITSLYNAKYLSKLIDKYISEFDRYGSKFSLGSFSIEDTALAGMKKKNRQRLIKSLGNSIIRGSIRGSDEAARIDGTRFTVLFPNTNHDGATCASLRVKGKISGFLDSQGIGSEDDEAVQTEILEYPKDRDAIELLAVNLSDTRVTDRPS